MVTQLTPAPHPILAAVLSAQEALDGVGEAQPLYMTPEAQTAAITELARLEAKTAELRLRVTAAAEATAMRAGARDVGDWLATLTVADFGAGRADARLARALDHTWHRVAAGMAEGGVSLAQARVVIDALSALPSDLDPDLVARAEEEMVGYCTQFRPRQLRRLGRHLLEVIAPDIADAELAKQLDNEERAAREKCRLTLKPIGDGTTRLTGLLPTLDAERLRTYLDAFTSPRKEPGTINGEVDRIPYPRRRGHAFCALLEHLDPTKLPKHGGDTTTLLVTIPLDALRNELGTGSIVGGEPLTATQTRRLACTAGIIPAVLDSHGEILDLGRTRRLFNPAQRKALRLKHQHCRAEGCTIPATWCEAHHDHPWSTGGPTNLANGTLYCSHHHHRAHDPTYTTEKLPNGDTRFHRRT